MPLSPELDLLRDDKISRSFGHVVHLAVRYQHRIQPDLISPARLSKEAAHRVCNNVISPEKKICRGVTGSFSLERCIARYYILLITISFYISVNENTDERSLRGISHVLSFASSPRTAKSYSQRDCIARRDTGFEASSIKKQSVIQCPTRASEQK